MLCSNQSWTFVSSACCVNLAEVLAWRAFKQIGQVNVSSQSASKCSSNMYKNGYPIQGGRGRSIHCALRVASARTRRLAFRLGIGTQLLPPPPTPRRCLRLLRATSGQAAAPLASLTHLSIQSNDERERRTGRKT